MALNKLESGGCTLSIKALEGGVEKEAPFSFGGESIPALPERQVLMVFPQSFLTSRLPHYGPIPDPIGTGTHIHQKNDFFDHFPLLS